MAIEIVDFPIKNGDFSLLFVCSPEGTPVVLVFFPNSRSQGPGLPATPWRPWRFQQLLPAADGDSDGPKAPDPEPSESLWTSHGASGGRVNRAVSRRKVEGITTHLGGAAPVIIYIYIIEWIYVILQPYSFRGYGLYIYRYTVYALRYCPNLWLVEGGMFYGSKALCYRGSEWRNPRIARNVFPADDYVWPSRTVV